MQRPAKKGVVIKPFKSSLSISSRADDGDSTWAKVAKSIDVIFTREVSDISFESVYTSCYNLVIMKKSELLYNGIKDKIKQYLLREQLTLRNVGDDQLLAHLVELFEYFNVSIGDICSVAMYLERNYIESRDKIGIRSMGLVTFRSMIVCCSYVLPRITRILLQNVRSDRDGYVIDKTVLQKMLRVLADISVHQQINDHCYVDLFERPFLADTRAYYEQESQDILITNGSTLAAFCDKAEGRLLEENGRLTRYLLRATEDKLKSVLHDAWIARHANFLFAMEQNGFVALLTSHQLADIKNFYNLCARLPEVRNMLRSNFYSYVRERGLAILSDTSGDSVSVAVNCISRLTELKINSSNVLVQCFHNDTVAGKRLKDALDEVVNLDARCANYLAVYMDCVLRGGSSTAAAAAPLAATSSSSSSSATASLAGAGGDQDQDRLVEQMMAVFKHIHDKDVFENYYKGLLSKRLLGGKNASDELEKAVLRKLKSECGYQFTSKMEGMFTDISLSKVVLEEFRSFLAGEGAGGDSSSSSSSSASLMALPELDVTMLTSGYWPNVSASSCSFALPLEIKSSMSSYTAFYLNKHSGRKISWLTALGSADVRLRFSASCSKEFNVSTLQMTILALYAHKTAYTLQEIREACAVSDVVELKRHLLSLTTPKAKILLKSSKGKVMDDADLFTLNTSFDSKFRRIKVPLIALKEIIGSEASSAGREDPKALSPEVEESRKLATEATIVRIMKARKTLKHNELVAEVTRQLAHRFHSTLVDVKKCVESLIEREYLCRDPDERNTYKYLA